MARDYDEMSQKAAAFLARALRFRPGLLLGLATGATPTRTYERLAEMRKRGSSLFRRVCGHAAPGLLQVRPATYTPGWSLHETGTLRMGNDPKRFVTNRFGQTHDVKNLFVADASLFLGCSDKTTTLSILAFALRGSEYLVARMRAGEI
jgi:choline dehydrogenase-like flavoprotein